MKETKGFNLPLLIFYLCWISFTPQLAAQNAKFSNIQSESFEEIKAHFKNPGKDFQTAPLWVWNTKVTKTIIDSMMAEFKKNSFGGVFVHPRPGLITEYLSDEWINLYGYTINKAKELGMNIWIYDENSYPSGFAGGLVPDQMPASYDQGQMLKLIKSDTLPANTNDIFLCLKKDNTIFSNITKDFKKDSGKPGSYYIFKKQSYAKQAGMVGPPDFPRVDLLVKGVTDKFIDVTLEKYAKAFGNEFGQTIKGTFSDEPSIPTHGSATVRWAPDLFDVFREKWGYDLVPNLVSLYEEEGDWKRIRHNYQQTLLQMFIDRWSKPMSAFAQKNNLLWTGHYWEHGWPDPNEGPDNMAMYAWHQQPGIDMLFNQFNETSPNAQFGNIRSVKELSSVANQFNRKRTLSETYGGAGWDLTFKEMKRLGDWEYALGVNFMNQHLSWMSMRGSRKYDYPPTFSYQNSWWPCYKGLNEYFGRLSYALSRGQQRNDILVLEPTTSAWMYYSHAKQNGDSFYEIGKKFQEFVTQLQKAHVDYDLGSENIIKDHGAVEGAEFKIAAATYSIVVLPPTMDNLDSRTYELLKDFVQNGGKIISFSKPQRIDGRVDDELSKVRPDENNLFIYEKLTQDIIERHFQKNDFRISIAKETGGKGNLYHHRRMLKDGQLLFLSNADMENSCSGSVSLIGKKGVQLLDLNTGKVLPYSGTIQNGDLTVLFEIPPAGSKLFYFSDKPNGVTKPIIKFQKQPQKGSPLKINRPKENTFMVDFCVVKVNGKVYGPLHVKDASTLIFKEHGFNKNPWNHQMQFKKNIIDRDTFSRASGYEVAYKFNIENNVKAVDFRGVIEEKDLWTNIKINGQAIQPDQDAWWLDRSFGVLRLGKYLHSGENILSLTLQPMSIYGEIGSLFILGNFNLQSTNMGWQIIEPQPLQAGIWKNQGLPTYGQGITYEKEFSLNAGPIGYEVMLDDFKGTVAEVQVNGKIAGIIYSDPYTLDISDFVKTGKNKIEVMVIGSLRNLLGPHYGKSATGYSGPDSWGDVKDIPPGRSYNLFDYGLKDIRLFALWH